MDKPIEFLICSVFLIGGVLSSDEKLPDYIHVCKKDTADMDNCIVKAVEHLKPYLIEGVPELDIPKIDPILIGDLVIAEAKQGEPGLKITTRNIKAYGASDFTIKKLEMPEFGRKYNFKLHFPHLYVNGRYSIDGRLLLLPIKGSGKFTGNFTDCIGDVKVIMDRVDDNNEVNHIEMKKITLKISVGKGMLFLDNLFGGNKELGAVVNESINNNFNMYAKEIIPLVEKSLAKHFTQIGNKVVGKYTDEQLFPK